MTEKMMERVAQLLRKAESTTPHEAEALTAAAEKLIIKHGIDRAMLDASQESHGKPKVVIEKIPFEGMWQTAWADGFGSVVDALGLKPLTSKTWDGTTLLWIIGFESDVEEAAFLITSLKNQSEGALKSWWKETLPSLKWMTSHQRHVEKRTYMKFFGIGVASRIFAERESAAAEAGPGTELVLVDRRTLLDNWTSENLQTSKAKRDRNQQGWIGQSEGFAAGKEASLGKGVEGASRGAVEA